ncbi:DNA gyrase subunit A, partial [Patescibacteria group bacterium]|nr:DNA gyrase subunit A [Patescibacteria group bacterium]
MENTNTILDTQDEIIEKKDEKGVRNVSIVAEMQSAYLDYAMSVIVARALPDVRDGLKPVQRRIIFSASEIGLNYSAKLSKCAKIVGDVMGKYHPHGDSSIYEAMVRMGQDFSLRYPLIHGQGNFGSIDGDAPAAYRYTEAKLSKIAGELYKNIDEETVDFVQNYSGERMEPVLLPSSIPNLLLNGGSGIAVGMATNIPTHNLGEVVDALQKMIEKNEISENLIQLPNPKKPFETDKEKIERLKTIQVRQIPIFESSATLDDLMMHIQGPDFPTGGVIYDRPQIREAYATGRGRVITRGVANIEESKVGKQRIIITQLPYQVIKSKLVAKIAELIKDKKIEGISDLRDESNRDGIRVVIEIKQTGRAQKILNQLYQKTELQNNFNCNFVALLNNEPKLFNLKGILEEFVRHRQLVVIRRSEFKLAKFEEREHILQGLKIAIDNIDDVIETIKKSESVEDARNNLVKKFALSYIQADAILEMQLRRLAKLERDKIEQELKDILGEISKLKTLLSSPTLILEEISRELLEIKEKYGDKRKTKVIKGKVGEFSEEDLIIDVEAILTITKQGYIKRLNADTYKNQGRGGKGISGMNTKEGDYINQIGYASTHDEVLFFTNKGRVFKKRAWDIPESSRHAKGINLVNLLNLGEGEKVSNFSTIKALKANKYVLFCTTKGTGKRTVVTEFENIRQNGLIAIKLKPEDDLAYVGFTSGDEEILVTTSKGKAIRFKEKDLRPMGRAGSGVRIVNTGEGFVVNAQICPKEEKEVYTLTISEKGFGKKTALSEYEAQHRGGKGIKTSKITQKTGDLVDSIIVPN